MVNHWCRSETLCKHVIPILDRDLKAFNTIPMCQTGPRKHSYNKFISYEYATAADRDNLDVLPRRIRLHKYDVLANRDIVFMTLQTSDYTERKREEFFKRVMHKTEQSTIINPKLDVK